MTIQERILAKLSKKDPTLFAYCCTEVRKCFGSADNTPGTFWEGDKIVAALDKAQISYEKLNVWTPDTRRAYEEEKKHIYNCLNLPKVITE